MMKHTVIAFVLLSVAAGLAAQTPPQDPWMRVPPLPTTCYYDTAFDAIVHRAVEQNNNDYTKQKEINIDVKTKFEQMDMQERMRRMQEFMMKNPQAAAKAMEAQHTAATGMVSDATGADESKQRLDSEFDRTHAAWTAEFDRAAEPWRARRKQLFDTKTELSGPIHVWTSAEGEAEHNSLIQKENGEYERRCSTYYGPNGTVPTWLATYRRASPARASSRVNAGPGGTRSARSAYVNCVPRRGPLQISS